MKNEVVLERPMTESEEAVLAAAKDFAQAYWQWQEYYDWNERVAEERKALLEAVRQEKSNARSRLCV